MVKTGDRVSMKNDDGRVLLGVVTYAPNPCPPGSLVGVAFDGEPRVSRVYASWLEVRR